MGDRYIGRDARHGGASRQRGGPHAAGALADGGLREGASRSVEEDTAPPRRTTRTGGRHDQQVLDRLRRPRRPRRHGPGRHRPPTSAATRTSTSPPSSTRPRRSRAAWTSTAIDTLWLAEHHFQHEGYECHPEHPHDGRAPGARDLAAAHRLRLQHRADVAPAPARRGLRDRRHPHRTAAWCSAWAAATTRARWRRSARRCSTPTRNRELFEEQVEIIMKAFDAGVVLAPGKHYTLPPARAVPRLRAEGDHAGAAARAPARRDAGSRS